MAVETPDYEVLEHDGRFELRRYGEVLTANIHISASGYGEAANAGFRPLADYIFGDNHASGRIAMTAPVSAGRSSGHTIAMTAPVSATRSKDDYVVSFTMPAGLTMEELPLPNDPRVTLESAAPRLAAAVRFSGYFSERVAARARCGLAAWMKEKGLIACGEPVAAQYDVPWKPWFARRNEILIPVEDCTGDSR
jgi:hypothetical protein